uniref:Uncharacterized protein n=1 Tax=Fagus sylvatica TaxID=28930 RepID=A0A2N9GLA8_FAGSY
MAHLYGPGGMKNPSAELWHRVMAHLYGPGGMKNPSAELWHRVMAHLYGPGGMKKPVRRVVAPSMAHLYGPGGMKNPSAELWHRKWIHVIIPTGSGNEFAAEDEGEFDAVEAAESASAAIQSPFASLERLGAEVDFYDYSVPRDGVQFLEAIWKKYGNFISNFKLGNFVGGAMLNPSLLCVGTNEEHQL